jgi:hypothetical protein
MKRKQSKSSVGLPNFGELFVSRVGKKRDRETVDAASGPLSGLPSTIAPEILKHYPDLNSAQREIVAHLDGPLLVVAGPGSGKTYSIVLRALNLLLLEVAAAKEIVLCTLHREGRVVGALVHRGVDRDVGYVEIKDGPGRISRPRPQK